MNVFVMKLSMVKPGMMFRFTYLDAADDQVWLAVSTHREDGVTCVTFVTSTCRDNSHALVVLKGLGSRKLRALTLIAGHKTVREKRHFAGGRDA